MDRLDAKLCCKFGYLKCFNGFLARALLVFCTCKISCMDDWRKWHRFFNFCACYYSYESTLDGVPGTIILVVLLAIAKIEVVIIIVVCVYVYKQ